MTSKPSIPQTPSKIPKLVAPTSTLSPRGRTPSFIMGDAPSTPASSLKVKRGLSSPRQPLSFRVQGTPSTPISPRPTHQKSSIKSKSNDETTRYPGEGDVQPIDPLPDVVEDEPPRNAKQGGEGDMPSPLGVRPNYSEMKVKSDTFSLREVESLLTCNPNDVNVLYSANPMRMDSIVSVSNPTPQRRESPTYLGLYEQEAKESLETIRSMQALESCQNMSLEWDFAATGGDEERHENYTQTSGILVETVDRASSAMPLPSFSKESLLDQQTTPLAVLDALTTEEEEGGEVTDEMSSYVYNVHEAEGERGEKDEVSHLITITTPVKEEDFVVKIEQREKPESQFTPRCYMDEAKARYQETSQDYDEDETDDEVEVKHVPFASHHSVGTQKMARSSTSVPQQPSSRSIYRDTPEPRGAPAQSSASVPHHHQQSSRSIHRDTLESKAAQTQPSASVTQQYASPPRPVYRDTPTPEPRGAQAQSTASIPHQRKGSKIPLPEWQVENLKPKLSISASGGAIEIQPPPAQQSLDDLMNLTWRQTEKNRLSGQQGGLESKESASIFSPVQSRIILEQCSANFGKGMRGSLEICNSTSFPQGFKVVGNYATRKDLKFTPEIGLIPPHGKVTVSVSSYNSTICTPNDAENYCVWVHMFRAFCTDVHELQEFYSKLERQHPELIQTSQIKNFIIWNNDDLPGMMEMINSVHDEMEKEALMGEIHRHLSSNNVINESSLDRLESLQTMMLKSNSNLKKLGRDLSDISKGMQLFLFMALMIYGMIFLLPYFHKIPESIVKPVAPEPEPEECTLCPSSWMPSWEDMQRGKNDRMKNTYNYILSYF